MYCKIRIVYIHYALQVEEKLVEAYMTAYNKAHSKVARPLTRQQIIQQARERGIEVTEDNFNTVYR